MSSSVQCFRGGGPSLGGGASETLRDLVGRKIVAEEHWTTRAVPGDEVRLFLFEKYVPASDGSRGERGTILFVHGSSMASQPTFDLHVDGVPDQSTMEWFVRQGYYNQPDVWARAMRNLWFHTGDRGRMDEDGYLYFAGRNSELIRRRGENISAIQVEQVIMRHPAVAMAAWSWALRQASMRRRRPPKTGCGKEQQSPAA